MISGVSRGLRFRRLGVFGDGSVLAFASDTGTRKNAIFLIAADEEQAYCRKGAHTQWQRLDRKNMETLLQSICQAIIQGLAVLKIDGNADELINREHLTRRTNMFAQRFRTIQRYC